jgi:phage tail P2-like protein
MDTLLPHNSTVLERAIETTVRETLETPTSIDTLWSAKDCPRELLPFLAWALSVDHWDSAWPESRKRAVIASSVFVHRHKGTAGAVKAALGALDLGVTISEWFEHGGERYSFRADVRAHGRAMTAKDISDIHKAIANSKNARSYLERLRVYLASNQSAFLGMTTQTGRLTRVAPYVAQLPDQIISAFTGGVTAVRKKITLGAI